MIKMNVIAIVALLVFSISAYGQSTAFQGLSGVAVGADTLYLVGDRSHGALFTVNDWQPPENEGQFTVGGLQRTRIRATANSQDTKDLEAVALMGDTPVILAEESSKLFSLYYDRLWLYRIQGDQRDILDLKQVMGEDLSSLNWEGIDWIDQRRLLLAADHGYELILYILELPSHW